MCISHYSYYGGGIDLYYPQYLMIYKDPKAQNNVQANNLLFDKKNEDFCLGRR